MYSCNLTPFSHWEPALCFLESAETAETQCIFTILHSTVHGRKCSFHFWNPRQVEHLSWSETQLNTWQCGSHNHNHRDLCFAISVCLCSKTKELFGSAAQECDLHLCVTALFALSHSMNRSVYWSSQAEDFLFLYHTSLYLLDTHASSKPKY